MSPSEAAVSGGTAAGSTPAERRSAATSKPATWPPVCAGDAGRDGGTAGRSAGAGGRGGGTPDGRGAVPLGAGGGGAGRAVMPIDTLTRAGGAGGAGAAGGGGVTFPRPKLVLSQSSGMAPAAAPPAFAGERSGDSGARGAFR